MLLLDDGGYLAARGIYSPRFRLIPRRLLSGKWAVPESVLTDPNYSNYAAALTGSETGTVVEADFPAAGSPAANTLTVNGKTVTVAADTEPHSLQKPYADTFLFDLRQGDVGDAADPAGVRHRTEVISVADRFPRDQEIWQAWSTRIVTDDGFKVIGPTLFCLPMQWHSVDPVFSRSPILVLNYGQNVRTVETRSSAALDGDGNGVGQVRYSSALPPVAQWEHYVAKFTMGASGHLSFWINGVSVYSGDIPLAYYADEGDLAYLQWGLYGSDIAQPSAVYTANMEWGTTDLTARIATPLAVPF